MIQLKLKMEDEEAKLVLAALDGTVAENVASIPCYPLGSYFREKCKEENAALRRLRRHLKTKLGG